METQPYETTNHLGARLTMHRRVMNAYDNKAMAALPPYLPVTTLSETPIDLPYTEAITLCCDLNVGGSVFSGAAIAFLKVSPTEGPTVFFHPRIGFMSSEDYYREDSFEGMVRARVDRTFKMREEFYALADRVEHDKKVEAAVSKMERYYIPVAYEEATHLDPASTHCELRSVDSRDIYAFCDKYITPKFKGIPVLSVIDRIRKNGRISVQFYTYMEASV